MKKRLESLEQLQEIDIQIDGLKKNQSSLHDEINVIEQGLNANREELAVLTGQFSVLEAEKQEIEGNLAVEQDNINRSETNMKEIKTNKEFQAVGREIAAARKLAVEFEEQILQRIGQLEELSGTIAAKTADLAELEQNAASRRDEKMTEISSIQKDIDADLARREEITKDLPASLIKRYGNLRLQRRGQAVAIARDGYCLGCNMHLPPQLYNSLYKAEELVCCPHCQHVLFLRLNHAE